MKILTYSNVMCAPRVPLILLTVEKIERGNFDFVLLSSFPSCITQKMCNIYKQSAHQTTALLSEIFLFLVRATCELRSASYGSQHTLQTSIRHFVLTYMYTSKTKARIRTLYLTNDYSTIKFSGLELYSVCAMQ